MGLQEIFESYDKKKRKSHFKNLLAVAMSDSNLANVEFDFIIGLANKCYMTQDEVRRVIDHPEQINFYPPQTTRERIDQLYDLVTVMLVDGTIDPRELEICKTFAMRLGFRPAIIDQMIKDVVEYIVNGITAEIAMDNLLAKAG